MTSARRPLDLAISEAQWQQTVTELATTLGWAWYHTHDSRRSPAGFPDLVLVRDRVIFAELKVKSGQLTQWQKHWAELLRNAGAEVYCWHPSNYPVVEKVLKMRPR